MIRDWDAPHKSLMFNKKTKKMENYDYLEAALESVKRFKDYDPQIHDVFARKMTEYTIEQYPDESKSHPTTAFFDSRKWAS